MPTPDLETLCVQLTATPERLSVTFPGGAALDAQLPALAFPDPLQLAKQLMAEANAALAPLGPMFSLIDVVLALYHAVQAIPDAIAHLDPTEVADALPDVAQKAGRLLPLVPQLSVPLMVVGLIDVLLAFLAGLAGQLRAIVDQQIRIQRAAARAEQLGNAQLQAVADCAQGHVDAQMTSVAESLAPANRLIALINVFAELAGVSALANLPDLGRDAHAALQPVEDAVQTLQALRRAIPV
ncbi:MAG TPA: hypothetical protein VFP84_10550 [Kofleriaceae bacterium]|nr:hypothetical protein [Kofleriaceae bacterium]